MWRIEPSWFFLYEVGPAKAKPSSNTVPAHGIQKYDAGAPLQPLFMRVTPGVAGLLDVHRVLAPQRSVRRVARTSV
jgi:hypothetical protein